MKRPMVVAIIVTVLTLMNSELVDGQECYSPDINNDAWDWGMVNTGIDAFFSGIIAEYEMNNAISIVTENIGMSRKYIDATLLNRVLTIYTTPEFYHYEDQETAKEIRLRIYFTCTSFPRNLFFSQPINLANNHDPVFSQPIYELNVPLPLHRGFDLSYFEEISARDIDLTNNRVTFSSSASGFVNVMTSDRIGSDQKTFFAMLILNQQLLTLNEPFAFAIIATDSDIESPRRSVALIVITGNSEIAYIPSPRFEKAIYRGNITDDGILLVEDPTITRDSFSENIQFALSGDDADLFLFSLAASPNAINLSLRAPLKEEDLIGKTFLTATITAYHPEAQNGGTALVIDLHRKICTK